jgi:hypothetical protein
MPLMAPDELIERVAIAAERRANKRFVVGGCLCGGHHLLL